MEVWEHKQVVELYESQPWQKKRRELMLDESDK